MSTIKIGRKSVGHNQPCFVVAEIGINHNGSVDLAKKLIDAAVASGCDAVKFQKRDIDTVYTPEELARPRGNPFGPTNGDLKRGLEFGRKGYDEINEYCKAMGIVWFASPWDKLSVDFLERYDPPCYKIASACLTDIEFLKYVRSKGRPIILSTGMSSMQQIRRAVEILGQKDLVLLHCVATYPTVDEELNLKVIQTLEREFVDIPIGHSSHGYGTTLSVCAVAMGACVVERHITIDRTMWGSDQSASLEPVGLASMVKNIRRLERALGTGEKIVLDSEKPILDKLRRIKDF
jgi:N-acetylneuraminate synthase